MYPLIYIELAVPFYQVPIDHSFLKSICSVTNRRWNDQVRQDYYPRCCDWYY